MLQKLVETVSIDSKLFKKIELSGSLKEKALASLKGQHLEEAAADVPTAWEVPISKYDEENANGRIYPKALWERVINEQRHVWEGAPMLADHPSGESDGDPSRICGIWLEARIAPDGYVYGTFVPSGSLGKDMQEHLRNGLRAGTSSSGFGELMHDSKTVDPSTYMIERLSDWVLTPSQGTYFTYEAATRETKNASDSRLGESVNKQESVVRESVNTMKITKLEEKKFRRDMEAFLEDAQKIGDPQDRLREFEEILTYFEEGAAPDLKDRVAQKITEQRELIKTQLAEVEKLQSELGIKSTSDLKEKLTSIAEDADVLAKEATDWKKVATSLQKKLDEAREELAARPTTAYTSHLRSKLKKLYNEKRKVEEEIAAQQAKLREASVKKTKVLEAVDAEIVGYKTTIAEKDKRITHLSRQIERLQAGNAAAEAKIKEVEAAFKAYKENAEAAPKLMESPSDSISRYMNFREADKVDNYWADLAVRHGESIKAYEKKIRSAKTVREAMAVYMKILPMLNEGVEYEAARLPESVSLSLKERGKILEKKGVKLTATDIIDRLPEGWV